MKRSVVYPDWAEKYRGKGRTIRKVRNGYGLYECTSVYVKGQKYPKSVQKYLGMITEKDGFIPKGLTISSRGHYIEYGYSHFIMMNFKRDLTRSLNSGSPELLRLGIIYHMFGSISEVFIRSTYLSHGMEEELIQRAANGIAQQRLKRVSNRINSLLKEKIADEEERNILHQLLFLSVIDSESEPESFSPPPAVIEIIERNGLKL